MRYKRLAIFIAALFYCPYFICAQEMDHSPVFRDGQVIGSLDSSISQSCRDCYVIRKIKIVDKEVQLLVPVSIVSADGKKLFIEDYLIEEHRESEQIVLIANNSYTSEKFQLTFSGKNGGRWLSVQKTVNASYHYQVGKADYIDIPSTKICRVTFRNKIEPIPERLDFRNFQMFGSEARTCFHCPTDLTIDECIKRKRNKLPFKWRQDAKDSTNH